MKRETKQCEMCGTTVNVSEPNPDMYPGVYFCIYCNKALNEAQAKLIEDYERRKTNS